MNSWNDDTKKKILDLSKKSADIKDFSKYKSSDIENITLLNTLVNACISKLYEDLAHSEVKKTITTETQKPSSSQNDQEPKSNEETKVEEGKAENTQNNQTNINEESKIQNNEDSTVKSCETVNILNELEQGSEVDLNSLPSLKIKPAVSLTQSRKRSILKLRKNVSFNLQRNQIKIIF